MTKKRIYDETVVEKLGARSVAAPIYAEVLFQSVKNQKRSGEFSCTTSAAWLAEKLNCTPCCIHENLRKLKGMGFISAQRSKKFTKVYKGYVCDLKITPLIGLISNQTMNSINQTMRNPLEAAENKGSHSLARETIKETIKKEIYIKEKKSVDLTPEKKSEKSGEDLDE